MKAARAVWGVLLNLHVPCAVTGSLAALVWGNNRAPRDVDLEASEHAINASFVLTGRDRLDEVFRHHLEVNVVSLMDPCPPWAWVVVDGLPFVPPGYIIARKILRAAAIVQGLPIGGCRPPYDLADARMVAIANPSAVLPPAPPGVHSIAATLALGASVGDVRAMLCALPAALVLRALSHGCDGASVAAARAVGVEAFDREPKHDRGS